MKWETKGLLVKITPSVLPSSAQNERYMVRDEGIPYGIP